MKDTLSQEYGVTVDAVGAGELVRIIERGIRIIKERVRAIVNTLPFKLCIVNTKNEDHQMLNSGGIINCDITSSDLLRANILSRR